MVALFLPTDTSHYIPEVFIVKICPHDKLLKHSHFIPGGHRFSAP